MQAAVLVFPETAHLVPPEHSRETRTATYNQQFCGQPIRKYMHALSSGWPGHNAQTIHQSTVHYAYHASAAQHGRCAALLHQQKWYAVQNNPCSPPDGVRAGKTCGCPSRKRAVRPGRCHAAADSACIISMEGQQMHYCIHALGCGADVAGSPLCAGTCQAQDALWRDAAGTYPPWTVHHCIHLNPASHRFQHEAARMVQWPGSNLLVCCHPSSRPPSTTSKCSRSCSSPPWSSSCSA
jgi:hypothetical protein